jgi:FKBP-type peptidyl-prolyl cis-trans isomerase SlyD
MKVAPDTIVTLTYDLTNEAGEIIESSQISGPITFVYGRSGLIPGLDRRLTGMGEGEEANFDFPPEEAFGGVDDGPTRTIARTEFPAGADLRKGAEFEAGTGGGQTIKLRVVETNDKEVTVRLVHPLAGQKIHMTVRVDVVRAATAAEKESGKVQSAPPPPPKA